MDNSTALVVVHLFTPDLETLGSLEDCEPFCNKVRAEIHRRIYDGGKVYLLSGLRQDEDVDCVTRYHAPRATYLTENRENSFAQMLVAKKLLMEERVKSVDICGWSSEACVPLFRDVLTDNEGGLLFDKNDDRPMYWGAEMERATGMERKEAVRTLEHIVPCSIIEGLVIE